MAVEKHVKQRRFVSAAEDAALGVLMAAGHLQHALAEICELHGITTDQYGVLRVLRDAYPAGRARGEVAECRIQRAPDMTRMLDRLVRQGLARRTRDAEDHRCSLATITKAGLALLARMDPEIAAAMRHLTKSLSRPQLQQLTRLTDALVE
jgi:DNA-binding MarR family transcriptional regulator